MKHVGFIVFSHLNQSPHLRDSSCLSFKSPRSSFHLQNVNECDSYHMYYQTKHFISVKCHLLLKNCFLCKILRILGFYRMGTSGSQIHKRDKNISFYHFKEWLCLRLQRYCFTMHERSFRQKFWEIRLFAFVFRLDDKINTHSYLSL